MKYFLIVSLSAMVVAGVYGAADMTTDIRNGTMIDYENFEVNHNAGLRAVRSMLSDPAQIRTPFEKADAPTVKEKVKDKITEIQKRAEQERIPPFGVEESNPSFFFERFSRAPIDFDEVRIESNTDSVSVVQ